MAPGMSPSFEFSRKVWASCTVRCTLPDQSSALCPSTAWFSWQHGDGDTGGSGTGVATHNYSLWQLLAVLKNRLKSAVDHAFAVEDALVTIHLSQTRVVHSFAPGFVARCFVGPSGKAGDDGLVAFGAYGSIKIGRFIARHLVGDGLAVVLKTEVLHHCDECFDLLCVFCFVA